MRFILPGLLIILLCLLIPAVYAAPSLDQVNQKVCDRFEEDASRLAAIMDQVKDRKGIKETRVAFGGVDDQVKTADYWVTYAAEAIAFERAQKFSSAGGLKSNLSGLRDKVLRAKTEVGKALNE